jgi:hypothetical protein
MAEKIQKVFQFIWDWYYKTHSNPQDGELSARSQAFTMVVWMAIICLSYECYKHEITRDWVEAFFVLMSGVAATKVWKRGEAGAETGKGNSG